MDFKNYCIKQHDIVCNQKYDTALPYSFHLKMVTAQSIKWKHLLSSKVEVQITEMGAWGHDLIEDARVTYNDIRNIAGVPVADLIYACTDEKGKNRKERHNDNYFLNLSQNKLAIYVKLCDVISNVLYSLMTNSSMYKKYKSEFPNLKNKIYVKEYEVMFDYIEKLLTL